jgi:hypothetical protein
MATTGIRILEDRLAGAAALAVLMACASAGGGSTANPNLITREEIAASGAPTVEKLIERLRPRWLTSRGQSSINLQTAILVYQDDMQLGGVEVLARMDTDGVQAVRMLTGSEAGMLPGAGSVHVERAIVVQMRRQPRQPPTPMHEASTNAGRPRVP